MKKNSWKILLSVFLVITMAAGMLPCAAFADELNDALPQTETEQKEDLNGQNGPESQTGGEPVQQSEQPENDGLNLTNAAEEKEQDHVTINVRVYDDSTDKAYDVGTDTAGVVPGLIQSESYTIPELTKFVGAEQFGKVNNVVGDWCYPISDSQKVGRNVNWGTNSGTKTMTYHVDWYKPAEGGGEITDYLWNFTLKFDLNGGSEKYPVSDQTYGTNDKYTKSHDFKITIHVPPRDGYDFLGWSDTKDGKATYQPGDLVRVSQTVGGYNGGSVTKTLYAYWEKEETPDLPEPTPDLSKLYIEKTADVTSAKPGETITYTITVWNETGLELNSVLISDLISDGAVFNGEGGNFSITDETVHGITTDGFNWMINSIKNGGSAELKAKAFVNADAAAGTKVTNTAAVAQVKSGSYTYLKTEGYNLPSDSCDVEIEKADAKTEYTVTYSPGNYGTGDVFTDTKQPGVPLTLSSDCFLRSGYRQIGWLTNEESGGSAYRLGEEYTEDADITLYPWWGEIFTISLPLSVEVQKGGKLDPGKTTFSFQLMGWDGSGDTFLTENAGLSVLTDGVGSYGGAITLTGTADDFTPVLDGFFVRQVSGTDPCWDYSDAVYYVELNSHVHPQALDGDDDYQPIDCSFYFAEKTDDGYVPTEEPVQTMSFVNVYTKNEEEKPEEKPDWDGLTISKSANRTYSTCGSTITYKITVTNKTGVDLENINVLDLLDDTLVYHSSGSGYDPESGAWVISKLADGKFAELTLRAKIKKGLAIGTVVTNTAYLTEVTYDGEPVRMNPWLDAEASVTVVKGAPQTGDESGLGLWLTVMTASLAFVCAAAVVFKKRRSN